MKKIRTQKTNPTTVMKYQASVSAGASDVKEYVGS